MLLFKPLPGFFGGDEIPGLELGLKLLDNRGIHASGRAFPWTRFVASEQGFKSSLAHRRQPPEEVTACDAADVCHFRGGVLSTSRKLDGKQPCLAPAITLSGMPFINDLSHVGPAQTKFCSCHARS